MGYAFMSVKERHESGVWWCIPTKSAQGRLNQGSSPGFTVTLCQHNTTNTRQPTLTNKLMNKN